MKMILITYCIVLLMIVIFVPWTGEIYLNNGLPHRLITIYNFIWEPPPQWEIRSATIDRKLLDLEIGVTTLIAAYFVYFEKRE